MAKDPKSDEAGGKDTPLRIGTRSSQLALWQANFVKERLAEEGHEAELITISTQGDKDRNSPFSSMSGSAFFTKAIEEALLAEEVDIAVHSHKDLETTPTPGTLIAAIPQRAHPSDLLLVHPDAYSPHPLLPVRKGASLGSSSPRRQEQVRLFRPDIGVEELRGNVPTRIQKVRDRKFDAILLAKAGVDRLEVDVSDLETVPLPPERFIPAPAQGALAVQIREGDENTRRIVEKLHHPSDAIGCRIEREILRLFRGGCQLPFGAYCKELEGRLEVRSTVLTEDGNVPKRVRMDFDVEEEGIPEKVHATLISPEKRKVFISKDLSEGHWWKRCLEGNGHEVHARSLIDQEALPFDPDALPKADVLFFSSRNGVRFFLEKLGKEEIQAYKLAVYGEGTAEALADEGFEADFVGSGGSEAVAESLSKWMKEIGKDALLIPGPEDPASSIPDALKRNGLGVHQIPIYRSSYHSDIQQLPNTPDTLIFTSPSNLRAYLENGHRLDGKRVLAIGSSTEQAVLDLAPEAKVETPSQPGLLELLELFFSGLSDGSPSN